MEIQLCLFRNFRIYPSAKLVLHPRFNFFIGNNGAGKTTLLEGISVLLSGRSFKNALDTHLIRQREPEYYVAGRIRTSENLFRIEISYDKKSRKKNLLLDRKKVHSFRELLARFPFVSFLSEDIRIIEEGPVFRRQFFDRMISYIEPAFYGTLVRYRKVLRQRNKLLRQKDFSQMDFWNRETALYGAAIQEKRKIYTEEFNQMLENFPNLPEALKNLRFSFTPPLSPEEAEKKLAENQEKEAKMGFTLWGPHRDDFPFRFEMGSVKHYASQGQIKSSAFYLKLLQAILIHRRSGRKPVLLIDDVFAELDRTNREKILQQIRGSGFQTLMTSTREDFLEYLMESGMGTTFRIHQGEVYHDS